MSWCFFLFFQEEDAISGLVRSRGLVAVYKRQAKKPPTPMNIVPNQIQRTKGL